MELEQEVTIDPLNLIFVDMAIKSKNLVIEINGPYHYLMGDKSKVMNTDLLNQGVIEALGYNVETVNIDDFN